MLSTRDRSPLLVLFVRVIASFGLVAMAVVLAGGNAVGATFNTEDGPVVVRNWGYRLQGSSATSGELTVAPLAAGEHDLLVIDYSGFGSDATAFTPQEIDDIKHSSVQLGGDGKRKVVTSYISIGEASEFRSFWDDSWTASGDADSPLSSTAPVWLGPVNPSFPESRKVRYWDPEWQDIVFNDSGTGWLDQIVDQGFDGAYLDIVDAFFFWGNEVDPSDQLPGDPLDGQDAARRMVEFVVDMTAHARQTNPDFFVIPQNGAYILNDLKFGSNSLPSDLTLRGLYLDAIAAIGVEDTYYRGALDENNELNIDTGKVHVLQQDFLAAGKAVLVTDYVNEPAKAADFETRARADGFIPYTAPTRALDLLGDLAESLTGDFNNDGVVDLLDYSLWKAGFGSTDELDPDGNEDGVVNAADYSLWRDALPALTANAYAFTVPEPSTAPTMLLLGLLSTSARLRLWRS